MKLRIVARVLALSLLSPLAFAVQAGKTDGKGSADWNQFRGPKRDGHSPDTGLLAQWPSSGPPLAWKAAGIGQGFSSVCVAGTRVFTTGEAGGKCNLIALNVADGKVLWTLPIGGPFTENQGGTGPRSTPATDGAIVVAIAPTGEIVCARNADGRIVWKKRMTEFGASQPGFGFVESPFIDGNFVLISPGGSVVALSKLSGQQVWKSKKLKGETDYTSLSVAEMGRVKQYLVMSDKSVAGVLATNGAILWEGDFTTEARAYVATPVYANGVVFVAVGYGAGCKAFRVALAGNQIRFQEAYKGTQFQIHHGGMVAVGQHVYGLSDQGSLKCIDIATGNEVWADRSVGKGSIAFADGHLICRGEGGGVALVEASPEGFKEKGRFTPSERNGNKTWAHPAVSGGKLYLREQDVLLCYDVKAK